MYIVFSIIYYIHDDHFSNKKLKEKYDTND